MHPHLHIHIPIQTQAHTYSKYQKKTGILRVICLFSHRTYMSTVVVSVQTVVSNLEVTVE